MKSPIKKDLSTNKNLSSKTSSLRLRAMRLEQKSSAKYHPQKHERPVALDIVLDIERSGNDQKGNVVSSTWNFIKVSIQTLGTPVVRANIAPSRQAQRRN